MNYSKNYLNVSSITYPPKLKMYRSILLLTPEEETELSKATNDSCVRLFNYYISRRTYKYFIPTDYGKIGEALGWTASKTEKCKSMLIKAGYLLVKKDTLRDKTLVYRVLLGQDMVNYYLEYKRFPDDSLTFTKELVT